MELPFPKSRSGWFVSFILTLFSFWFYYNHLYINIYQAYQEQFFVPTIVADNQIWQVEVQIPKYTSFMAPGWVYGKIHNKSEDDQEVNLSVVFDEETTILVPSIYKDEVFQRQISEKIYGLSTAYFRIQFGNNSVSVDNCTDNLKLILNAEPLTINDALPCPQDNTAIDKLLSLKRAIIENLLLPPWANTLMPALILFFGYLAEKKIDEEEEQQNNFIAVIFIGVYSFVEIWSFYIITSSSLWEPDNRSYLVYAWLVWPVLLVIPWSVLQGKISSYRLKIVSFQRSSGSGQNDRKLNINKCPACGTEIGLSADACPNCGRSFSTQI